MTREKCPICGADAYEVIEHTCDIGDHCTQRGTEEGCHACGWTPDDYEPDEPVPFEPEGLQIPF